MFELKWRKSATRCHTRDVLVSNWWPLIFADSLFAWNMYLFLTLCIRVDRLITPLIFLLMIGGVSLHFECIPLILLLDNESQICQQTTCVKAASENYFQHAYQQQEFLLVIS